MKYLDGRHISSIQQPYSTPVKSDEATQLVYSREHRGDRDEEWVLAFRVSDGKEVARYNVRYIATIHWADE